MPKKNADHDTLQFDPQTRTVMTSSSYNDHVIKEKILAIKEVVPGKSNSDLHLVLQYYDNNVERAIHAFIEDGAQEALNQWQHSGPKVTNKKRRRNKPKSVHTNEIKVDQSDALNGEPESALANHDTDEPSTVDPEPSISAPEKSFVSIDDHRVNRDCGGNQLTGPTANHILPSEIDNTSMNRQVEVMDQMLSGESSAQLRPSMDHIPMKSVDTQELYADHSAVNHVHSKTDFRANKETVVPHNNNASSDQSNRPSYESRSLSNQSDIRKPVRVPNGPKNSKSNAESSSPHHHPPPAPLTPAPKRDTLAAESHVRDRPQTTNAKSSSDKSVKEAETITQPSASKSRNLIAVDEVRSGREAMPVFSVDKSTDWAEMCDDNNRVSSKDKESLPDTTHQANKPNPKPKSAPAERQGTSRGDTKPQDRKKKTSQQNAKLTQQREITTPAVNGGVTGQSLERLVKDLHRQAVSLDRLRLLLNEELVKSHKRIKGVFGGVRQSLNEREEEMVTELEQLKRQATETMDSRQALAEELRVKSVRATSLGDKEVTALRTDIKHFLIEKRIDEDLCRSLRFVYNSDTVVQDIKKLGEVVPLNTPYYQKSESEAALSTDTPPSSAGNQQPSTNYSSGDRVFRSQQSRSLKPSNQQAGNQQSGNQQAGNQPPRIQKPGTQQASNQQPRIQKPGNQQASNQQASYQQASYQQASYQQASNQQPRIQKPSNQQASNQLSNRQRPSSQQFSNQKINPQQSFNPRLSNTRGGNKDFRRPRNAYPPKPIGDNHPNHHNRTENAAKLENSTVLNGNSQFHEKPIVNHGEEGKDYNHMPNAHEVLDKGDSVLSKPVVTTDISNNNDTTTTDHRDRHQAQNHVNHERGGGDDHAGPQPQRNPRNRGDNRQIKASEGLQGRNSATVSINGHGERGQSKRVEVIVNGDLN